MDLCYGNYGLLVVYFKCKVNRLGSSIKNTFIIALIKGGNEHVGEIRKRGRSNNCQLPRMTDRTFPKIYLNTFNQPLFFSSRYQVTIA